MDDRPGIRSQNLNSGTDFPYLVLNVIGDKAFPRNPGFRVLHSHEDLQLIYVLNGKVLVKTLESENVLSKGEGIFINKNVVHLVLPEGDAASCRYDSFLFPDYFLTYYKGSPMEGLTEEITRSLNITCLMIPRDNDWGRRCLSILEDLSDLERHKSDKFHCYEVVTRLNALWLLILRNHSNTLETKESLTATRTRTMLRYIEEHYAEDLSLEAIARNAGISVSEALRCFKLSLDTTPYRYLVEYRLSKAADLLANTDIPIGRVSDMTGFHQQSYFGRCFRESTGLSPGAYRRKLSQMRASPGPS